MTKTALGLLVLLVGIGQAWDSNLFEAEKHVVGIVLAGLLAPAAAIAATRDVRIRAGSVAGAAALIIVARFVSDVPMSDLALAAFFPGVLVLFDHMRTAGPESADGSNV